MRLAKRRRYYRWDPVRDISTTQAVFRFARQRLHHIIAEAEFEVIVSGTQWSFNPAAVSRWLMQLLHLSDTFG